MVCERLSQRAGDRQKFTGARVIYQNTPLTPTPPPRSSSSLPIKKRREVQRRSDMEKSFKRRSARRLPRFHVRVEPVIWVFTHGAHAHQE